MVFWDYRDNGRNYFIKNDSSPHLYSGRITSTERGPRFDTGEIQVWISDGLRSLESTHISIDPKDIIVSKKPFASSARNVFEGVITKIADQGGKVLLEVGSGEIFKVFVTPVSLREMGLNVGSHVYLTFKATSVRPL